MQTLLQGVENDKLVIALKGASEEIKTKITTNMSSRAAEMLLEDLELKGPVRLSEVEALVISRNNYLSEKLLAHQKSFSS